MLRGIVVRTVGGFSDVAVEGSTYRCVPRGRLKLQVRGRPILPGDRVTIRLIREAGPEDGALEGDGASGLRAGPSAGDGLAGVIEAIEPRSVELLRPPVANVTQVVAVAALTNPDPVLSILDRILIIAEQLGLNAIICINKMDLMSQPEARFSRIVSQYAPAGYSVIATSAKTGYGIDRLVEAFRTHISVLSGPSGVGKSAILNAVFPEARLRVGELSRKLGGRGRHTTREVQLLRLDELSYVADAPGFTKLDLALHGIDAHRLGQLYPEFRKLASGCRFAGCTHVKEHGCAIKDALERGQISHERYARYIEIFQELAERRDYRF